MSTDRSLRSPAPCSPAFSSSPAVDVARLLVALRGIAWAGIFAIESDGALRSIASCGDAGVARVLVPEDAPGASARASSIGDRVARGPWTETLDPPTATTATLSTTVAFFPVRSSSGRVVAVVALAGTPDGPALVDRLAALTDVVTVIASPLAAHLRIEDATL